ncbi:MAG: potassium transporter TrkG [Bacteroidota bacterium]|nr:potassium transporter TrkG [Bacteroidota bacterium]
MRQNKINYSIIAKIIGILLSIEGLFILLSLPFSIYFATPDYSTIHLFESDKGFWPLIISGLITIATGLIIFFAFRNASSSLTKKEGFVIVTFSWIIISIFGALPLYLSSTTPTITDAFFETISGFTTTGSSILNDIEIVPKGILFWRSMTHWIGGMGIIVLSLAILPIFGIGGMSLFVAEVPGPTPDKLHPRIAATAKRLWGIYVLLTFIETALLMFGGMDLFDGLCHAFGTIATGGFSTQNASVADYSPYIQYVIIVFMILAGTNFTLHYLALHGNLKETIKNEEYRYYMLIILVFSAIIATVLILNTGTEIEASVRNSLFQVVSIVTTTGFVTDNYLLWPNYLWMLIFLLMFIGGNAGSTGGGIKVIRQLLIIKNSFLELKRLVHPNAIIPVRLNDIAVPKNIIFNILAFVILYFFIFAISIIIMSVIGLDYQTSIGAVAASLGNIGPGLGSVGPICNYSDIPDVGKWFLSFLMLLGRLELFTVLILFSPAFWKN